MRREMCEREVKGDEMMKWWNETLCDSYELSFNDVDNSFLINNKQIIVLSLKQIIFEPEDAASNTTFRGADNNEYHIQPIPLNGSNVRVRCNCLDFYYRFAAWNAGDNSLQGRPAPPYNPKGERPPVNPTRVPGVCKHVIKVVDRLKQGRIVT